MRQKSSVEPLSSPLQLLPGYLDTCFDPFDLEVKDAPFCESFIEKLLNGQSIRLNFKTNKHKKNNLDKIIEIQETQDGNITGFGYPMFIMGDSLAPDAWVAMPLFVWEVQFIQSLSKKMDDQNQW